MGFPILHDFLLKSRMLDIYLKIYGASVITDVTTDVNEASAQKFDNNS